MLIKLVITFISILLVAAEKRETLPFIGVGERKGGKLIVILSPSHKGFS